MCAWSEKAGGRAKTVTSPLDSKILAQDLCKISIIKISVPVNLIDTAHRTMMYRTLVPQRIMHDILFQWYA